MRISRVHLPLLSSTVNETLNITGDKAHYIRNVLRIRKGHSLIFFTQDGIEYSANIAEIKRHDVILENINRSINPTPPSIIKTTIIQGISSGDRMDYTVQKAAELGASVLIPVFADFCSQKIPTNKFEKKQAHWQSVAISACEQSGRCDLLKVLPITRIENILDDHSANGIFLEPTAETLIVNLPEKLHQKISIFIGPEGGFSECEISTFHKRGMTGVQLGKRVLRTETAAPVILAAIHALFGDFI